MKLPLLLFVASLAVGLTSGCASLCGGSQATEGDILPAQPVTENPAPAAVEEAPALTEAVPEAPEAPETPAPEPLPPPIEESPETPAPEPPPATTVEAPEPPSPEPETPKPEVAVSLPKLEMPTAVAPSPKPQPAPEPTPPPKEEPSSPVSLPANDAPATGNLQEFKEMRDRGYVPDELFEALKDSMPDSGMGGQ